MLFWRRAWHAHDQLASSCSSLRCRGLCGIAVTTAAVLGLASLADSVQAQQHCEQPTPGVLLRQRKAEPLKACLLVAGPDNSQPGPVLWGAGVPQDLQHGNLLAGQVQGLDCVELARAVPHA